MTYKVTKQFANNREIDNGQFKTLEQAKAHMQAEVQKDAAMKVKSIYRIYEWDDLLEECHSEKVGLASSHEDQSGSQGKGSNSKPSPLSTIPRPPGSPQTWQKDDDDDKGNH